MICSKEKIIGIIRILFAAVCIFGLVVSAGTAMAAEEIKQAGFEAGAVSVSDVDAFLAAIAPDTVIVLEPGEYNLRNAQNYGRGGTQWYHWESVFDGFELVITDVTNLTICGRDYSQVTISTEPRYADVLQFNAVSEVVLDNLTVGHTREPGTCSGGVLNFEHSNSIEILNARLYGCGVLGVTLEECRNVHVDCSDIYECSEGAAWIARCRNVLFENSKFYDNAVFSGLFEITGSDQVAVINSEIFNNMSWGSDYGSLVWSNCPGVYLGGLDVHDNSFGIMFDTQNHPVTLEKSRFQWSASQWASNLYPVAADGSQLMAGDLNEMQMRTAFWKPQEMQVPIPAAPADDGRVHVCTVDEFLNAIGHDTTIYLEPGIYDLSTAASYGGFGGEFYHWEHNYDGPELVIQGVKGLTIEGAGAGLVTIVAVPRYSNVLQFRNVYGLTVRGITGGHTTEAGECSGGVIQVNTSSNINIEGCRLYGCGILGVSGMDSSYLYITGTEIYECSSGAAWFYGCHTVRVEHCNIHDITGTLFYADFKSTDVLVDGQELQVY